MKSTYPLFQSHLDLAHHYWTTCVNIGDIVIDATCGNGHDTLKLCQLALSLDKGKVYAFDIQREATQSTSQILDNLDLNLKKRVVIQQQCHSSFPKEILPGTVKLIVYNLGYLPGGLKEKTTEVATTLKSLEQALPLLQKGGVLSVTCYPGHEEGGKEQEKILDFVSTLSPKEWSCCHHVWLNRHKAPSLILVQKTIKTDNGPVTS